jgi:hypothetical protein
MRHSLEYMSVWMILKRSNSISTIWFYNVDVALFQFSKYFIWLVEYYHVISHVFFHPWRINWSFLFLYEFWSTMGKKQHQSDKLYLTTTVNFPSNFYFILYIFFFHLGMETFLRWLQRFNQSQCWFSSFTIQLLQYLISTGWKSLLYTWGNYLWSCINCSIS